MKIYIVPPMHVTFVVNCWDGLMKPFNHSLSTNLQLCSSQSTNQPQFWVWGERGPKSTFAPSPRICRYGDSLTYIMKRSKLANLNRLLKFSIKTFILKINTLIKSTNLVV